MKQLESIVKNLDDTALGELVRLLYQLEKDTGSSTGPQYPSFSTNARFYFDQCRAFVEAKRDELDSFSRSRAENGAKSHDINEKVEKAMKPSKELRPLL